MSSVMRISRSGRVSIPAATRARWGATEVAVADMGDYLAIRPATDGPIAALRGKYVGRGPSTGEMRRPARCEEADGERRERRS